MLAPVLFPSSTPTRAPRWHRRRRPHASRPRDAPPLLLPDHLADARAGLLVVRPGPLGPDIADLNRTAATLLDGEPTQFLGTLVADCRCLREVAGLAGAVADVARGSATSWRTTHTSASGDRTQVAVSQGPVEGSALLQLLRG